MRTVTSTLGRAHRPLSARELADAAGTSVESTRRALRNLHASGRVSLLGTHRDAAQRWCSPENLPNLSRLWPYLQKL